MLRVAVIGCGPIGNRHADIYKDDPTSELVAVCDIIKERADKTSKRVGAPAFYDCQKLLDTLKPEVVSVATGGVEYGSDHYEPTMQALEAGCHVLGEKPICNEIAKAEEMVALAKKKGLCYGIDMNHRFTPAYRLARQWVDEGRIGHPLFVNMAMWIKNPAESSPWYMFKALNPHSVDIMRYFAGDIEAVQAFAMKAPGRTIWTTMQMNCRFKNGAVGHLSASYDIERGHPMERCEMAGLKGRLVVDDMWREATLYPAGNPRKEVYTNPLFGGYRDFVDTFIARLRAFTKQIDGGAKPEEIDGSGEDGLAAQKVLQAAIESVQGEKVVYVK
ncbi:MAG: Gfo/Idh/MocA family oxidoreductase [Candidatus Sumerlaeota bacterium]|nr:Gfo/Idh/MocA family oxidoreductase [Candidatus Sumerlaeota bacterium]